MYIETYTKKQKENLKQNIVASFYSAYFYLKGQKGLSGEDLTKVLRGIDGKGNEMTDEEMFESLKSLL